MIELMIALAAKNNVTKEKREFFQKKPFDPFELLTIKELNRKELLYLMVFCEIRLANGVPVVAMTDDELRMAYVLWRAEGQKERNERKREAKRRIRVMSRVFKNYFERRAME